MIDIQHS
ncbi:hypothetical protein AYI69_g3965, partial [Smittium culicis]